MRDEFLRIDRLARLLGSFPGVAVVAWVLASGPDLLQASSGLEEARGAKPNIIYIMADDLGYGDLGAYGQETLRTPNLDRLAANGLRFTDHYAGNTVCRPSRLYLWTGLHAGHAPIHSNAGYQFQNDEPTVAELLKRAGYATGGIGKWAMGGVGTPGHPNKNGFDHWVGYLDQGRAHNYYPPYLWKNKSKLPLEGNVLMGKKGAKRRVAKPDHRVTYSHDVMTDHALDWIRRHADGPFLFHAHYTIPHANNQGGRVTGNGMEVPSYGPFADKDWPETEKGFAAMVHRLDRDVGRLVSLLQELGIAKNTLILFTSDNGPHHEGGHNHKFFNSNGPLRGFKRDLYEGGIRVPMIAYWPGTIEAGRVTDHPSAFWDFLPTACALAGAEPPENIDGISYLPTLVGEADKQKTHDALYWAYRNKEALRKGKWKAVKPGKNQAVELYNLEKDIGEQENLADERPDLTKRLKARMKQARR